MRTSGDKNHWRVSESWGHLYNGVFINGEYKALQMLGDMDKMGCHSQVEWPKFTNSKALVTWLHWLTFACFIARVEVVVYVMKIVQQTVQ